MVLYLVIGLGQQFASQWIAAAQVAANGASANLSLSWTLAGQVAMYAMICWTLPKLASNVIGGTFRQVPAMLSESAWRQVQQLSPPPPWSQVWVLRLLPLAELLPFPAWPVQQELLAPQRVQRVLELLPVQQARQRARQREEQPSGVAVLLRL